MVRIRIPYWINHQQTQTYVNEKAIEGTRIGDYLLVDNIHPGDTIELRFPIPESRDEYTIDGSKYTVTFRGSTVVDIQPRAVQGKQYPYYLRDHMKKTETPMRPKTRFAADRILPLQ